MAEPVACRVDPRGPLRQRPRPQFKDRPCLNYAIGRCPGPCQQLVSVEDYRKTVDQVAGFGVPVQLSLKGPKKDAKPLPSFDLLNLPRPKATAPWAYVKIAEGCDRTCGFCAIPTFRGPQRSRTVEQILDEVDQLRAATGGGGGVPVREIVLVAQDLASYGKDRPDELGAGSIVPLVQAVSSVVPWTRLLYLYPSDLTDELIDAILGTTAATAGPGAITGNSGGSGATGAAASIGGTSDMVPNIITPTKKPKTVQTVKIRSVKISSRTKGCSVVLTCTAKR